MLPSPAFHLEADMRYLEDHMIGWSAGQTQEALVEINEQLAADQSRFHAFNTIFRGVLQEVLREKAPRELADGHTRPLFDAAARTGEVACGVCLIA